MKLRVVEIDCPIETWGDQGTRELFCDVVQMKLKGYREKYFPHVLPVDGSDFVATHELVCNETAQGLIPLMGFRSITVDRAERHKMTFPAMALAQASGSIDHVKAVEKIMDECKKAGKVLSYEGSWTLYVGPQRDASLVAELQRIFRAIKLLHLEANGISESLLGATLRFGVEKTFFAMGYSPLSVEGRVLEAIPVPSMGGEKVLMVHLRQASELGVCFAEKYRALWDKRIIIAGSTKIKWQAA